MIVYCLKEYGRPNQKKHHSLVIFETRHTLLTYLDSKMEEQRQQMKPSAWRIETMDLPVGATDILQIAHLNDLSAMNHLFGNLVIWNVGEPNPMDKPPKPPKGGREGGKKK